MAVKSCFVYGRSDPSSCGDGLFGGCLALLVVGWWRVDSEFLMQETKLVAFLDNGLFHQVGGAHFDTVTPGSDGSPAAPQDHPRG